MKVKNIFSLIFLLSACAILAIGRIYDERLDFFDIRFSLILSIIYIASSFVLITSIGLMSGTSSDGVDASIIKSDGENEVYFLGNHFLPYEEKMKSKIRNLKEKINLILDLQTNMSEIESLEKEVTVIHEKIVNLIIQKLKLSKSEIDLVGFHGHTIFHSFIDKKTKQIGDGRLLSQLTGLNIVYNFRENDIKNGGQGAPLVPIFHKLLQLKLKLKTPIVFLNIGGISKLSSERLLDEFQKLLRSEGFLKLTKDKESFEIISLVFPQLKNISIFAKLNNFAKENLSKVDFIFLLALMIIDGTDNVNYFIYKFNLSKKDQKRLLFLNNFNTQKNTSMIIDPTLYTKISN